MKVYKTQVFDKWAKKENILNSALCEVVDEMHKGLIDADLGSGLVKKRMGKTGHGKRGSYRTLLAFKNNYRAIFLTGFSKNEMENIASDEKIVFKRLCTIYLSMSEIEIENMCNTRKLIEVFYEKV